MWATKAWTEKQLYALLDELTLQIKTGHPVCELSKHSTSWDKFEQFLRVEREERELYKCHLDAARAKWSSK